MKHFLSILSILIINVSAYAQNTIDAKEKQFTKTNLSFIENKGQITDQYGNARHDIQYKIASKGISVFIGNGQLHYQFSKNPKPLKRLTQINKDRQHLPFRGRAADTTPTIYTMYRLDVELQGSNPHAEPVAENKQSYYENYHTVALHTDNAVVCAYNKITYKNIYPFIDWVLYIKDNKLEYDFIVRPGGNVSDIKIKYNGATDIAHTDGNIKVITPMGDVSELKLYAYEQNSKKVITSQFALNHNTLSFKVSDYKGTLVIDPQLAWGTYFGGNGEDAGQGMACDKAGNVFICGITASINNIATTGSYQDTLDGDYDAFIAKFSNSGTLLWASYYGGESEDYADGIACDNNGNVYITGVTYSFTHIATVGSFQDTITSSAGGAFLAKFTNAGALQWATYYNGGGVAVTCDITGYIYMAGGSGITNNVATVGSYQDTLAGTGNACLVKFSNAGTRIWATYFGLSSGTSVAYSCVCDNAANIYIAGGAYHKGIITTSGCYQDSSSGNGIDGFVAKFDSTCNLKWSTYFGGDSSVGVSGITCDDASNVYITGNTNSEKNITTPGAYQMVYGGSFYDAFLSKFNDSGSLQWSTYFGSTGSEQGLGIIFNGLETIYISGYTSSTNGIATTGSYQNMLLGYENAFLAGFSKAGILQWATYYGGIGKNYANCIASDSIGNVFIGGYTTSTSNIATSNSYQFTYMDSIDAFIAKFDTGTTGVEVVNETIKDVKLYPSPNKGRLTVIGVFTGADEWVNIEIINFLGQVVYRDIVKLQYGMLSKNITMLNIVAGEHLMRVVDGNEMKTIKFLIE